MSDKEKREEAENALLDKVIDASRDPSSYHPGAALLYAEAFAWLRAPSNSHGGGEKPKS